MNKFSLTRGCSLFLILLFSSNFVLAMNNENNDKKSQNIKKKLIQKKSSKTKNKKTSPLKKQDSVDDVENILNLGKMSLNEKSRHSWDSTNQSSTQPLPTNNTIAQMPITTSVILARFDDNDQELAHYTQKLTFSGKTLIFDRQKARENVQYVSNASARENYGPTHLLVRGICNRDTQNMTLSRVFTTNIGFPNIVHGSNIPIDWVSNSSNAVTDNNYYIRKSEQWGGHSEPQFIDDFEAKFTQNHDDLVKYLIPKAQENNSLVYMCGLELFGPFDMCDRYNCVGKLKDFRIKHQDGQQSMSQYIRNHLQDRFQGVPEDAFVVIYHAQYSYKPIKTYHAKNIDGKSALKYTGIFGNNNHQFVIGDDINSNDFDIIDTHELSQHESLNVAPNNLYGYIHHFGNKKIKYHEGQNNDFYFPL